MSGGGLVVSILMLVLGIAWLVLPYLRGGSAGRAVDSEQQRQRASLIAAYERTLQTVRDLDEDFQVGKLSQDDYASERGMWVERGAALLETLEKTGGVSKKTKTAKSQSPAKVVSSATSDDPVEQAIAAYARAREKSQHN